MGEAKGSRMNLKKNHEPVGRTFSQTETFDYINLVWPFASERQNEQMRMNVLRVSVVPLPARSPESLLSLSETLE